MAWGAGGGVGWGRRGRDADSVNDPGWNVIPDAIMKSCWEWSWFLKVAQRWRWCRKRADLGRSDSKTVTDGKEHLVVTGDQHPWGSEVHDYQRRKNGEYN